MKSFQTAFLSTALLLATGATAAMADGNPWKWTPDQETGFYQRFTRQPVRRPPPPDFSIGIDGFVPDSVDLYDAPSDYDYEPARQYRYTSHNNQVYVIDPVTRRVVRILER